MYIYLTATVIFFVHTQQHLLIKKNISIGGPAQIAGVQTALVKNNDDGTFSLEEVKQKIRINPDCHEPVTSLIIVENTQNMCGGKVSRSTNNINCFFFK